MCWVCERLENLIAGLKEEQKFQEKISGDDYHRGFSKGFLECVRDLSEAVGSLRMQGLCEKLPAYEGALDSKQRLDILEDLLKRRDENSNQE